jgi:hypothetical protein
LIIEFPPALNPEIFPDFGSKKWIHQPAYELPAVLELPHEIQQGRADALEWLTPEHQTIGKRRKPMIFALTP